MSVALHDTISVVAKSDNGAQHVGRFIRRQVIPAGMSVTEAARRLGVGRPALSNLLNGRAALSQNMALRLEATFGADRARLLEFQAAGDRERRSVEDRAVAVGTYAPSFLTIEARRIEEWAAGSIAARDRLPVLLRRLVHATGRELRRVDFPGYDNAQRHSWDGRVEADAATLWVPEGRSFWEFGADKRPKAKADRDYRARLGALPPVERAKCTFVFVTPRNWEGKEEWARGREAAGDWKAVRALDASDLEQWLENTIAPRIWLAGELGIPTEGFQTLDRFWERWAQASNPPMADAIFAPSVAVHADGFTKWLKHKPDAGPLAVAADSREEAVAFLACLFRHGGAPAHDRDRAVVFESAATLRTLAGSPSPFIPIVYGEDTEREIASHYRQRHCIVVRPRNAVHREPDVAVELLGREAFEQALADMGVTERDRIDRLASESGRSPTVLRRRLSPIPAIGTPLWAREADVARSLIPMVLVGAWHKGSPADCEVLAALARRDYDGVEENVVDLVQRDDSPVWCVGQYRGVVSKIDALFAVSPSMTAADVTDFVDFAEYVLSESDPALELPADRRWAAGLYDKLRKHSDALRTGICETLVMLSVHGNTLFRQRLGVDVAADVAALVGRLLTPFTGDKLRSHDRDLPGYAEAAPGRFLELIEADLGSANPVLQALLKPAAPGLFDSPARAGVLWALERLAWNPRHFPRVVTILARLSETKIDDNWVNRPINSLSGLFRAWLPQTAASLDDRIRALETVWRRFPGVGWRICIQQFEGRQQVAFSNNRPRWREDAAGHGATESDRRGFVRKALDLALSRPSREHDEGTLGDLIERLEVMAERDRAAAWQVIEDWARTETDKKARARLRAKIRIVVLGWGRSRGLDAAQMDRAREVWVELGPKDPVGRHAWLFASGWLEYLDDDLDVAESDKRVDERRREAMREIWSVRGLDGALELAAESDGGTVGRYVAGCAAEPDSAADVLRTCLSTGAGSPEKLDAFMGAFMSCLDEDVRSAVIPTVAETAKTDQRVRLFKCAPFRDETWRLLDRQDARVRDRYWREVSPWMARTESETSEVIDRLVEAGRPWEAFSAVRFDWDKVETSRLKRLLAALVEVAPPPGRQFQVESWSLSKVLDSLDGRPGVTVDEMAQLEFAFIDRLDRSEHGIPNIERRVAKSPALFVQALALSTTRDDGGQDPMEWRVDDPGRRKALRHAAYLLLDSVGLLPGVDTGGRGDVDVLSRWVAEARRLCAEHGRAGIGDDRIGQLLSRAPAAEDGSWPCRPVCEVLQTIASRDVAAGFEVGVYNARGVHSRSLDEGGVQERALSAKYRAYAERLTFDYPYVANLLERIAAAYDWEAEREDQVTVLEARLGDLAGEPSSGVPSGLMPRHAHAASS